MDVDEGGSRFVRLRLDLAYDGTDFSGWAAQPGLRTVQGTLEQAIATMLRLPAVTLTVAGRTDAGVHARAQVCHGDLERAALSAIGGPERLTLRLARLLPPDVRVRRIAPAPAGFDARFSATWRRYAYRLCDAAAYADPLKRNQTLVWPRTLDTERMNTAAAELLGEHDFAAFCRRRPGATTIRTLRELSWVRNDSVVTGRVVADAFCHHMVRSLVGCLVAVGEARRPPDWPREVLSGGVRDPRVRVLPAHGLTLEEVGYPAESDLSERASESRSLRSLA